MTQDLWLLFGYLAAVLVLESTRSLLNRRAPLSDRAGASVPSGRKAAMAVCGAGTAILIGGLLVVWFVVNAKFGGVWPLGIRIAGAAAAAAWLLLTLVEWGGGFRIVSVGLRSRSVDAPRRSWRSALEIALSAVFLAVAAGLLLLSLRA
jgi:hypothetical protein